LRKSIALLSALLFISIIIVIINSIYNIYTKFNEQNTIYKNITQNSLLIKDIKKFLSNVSDDINSSDDLDLLFSSFMLNINNTKLNITISPVFDKININEIALKKTKPFIKQYLLNILSTYNIKDPEYFIDLILDTIDSDKEERNAYSEIKLIDPSFPNGKIYSFKHFKKILKFYAHERRDEDIFKIPWKKLIYFGDKKIYPIDCKRINKNIATFLGLVFEEYSCKEILNYDENKKLIKNLDIISFNKKTPYFIKVTIHYDTENFKLIYDINSKKVIDLEYYPLY